MKDRIAKIIREEGFSATKFADEIGVQASSVSHILSGRNNPSLDFIIKITERFRGINPEWLLTGKGEMYKSSQKETNLSVMEPTTIQEPDLFSSSAENVNESPLSEISEKRGIYYQIPENKIIEPDPQPKPEQIINTRTNTVDKIVIFYTDKTFEYYTPNK